MTHRPRARRTAALLSTGLVLALLPPASIAYAAQDAFGGTARTDRATHAAHAAHTVTLVTGDKVTVTDLGGGRRSVTVDRPRGAAGPVRTRVSDGHITVVPREAEPYLRAGTLDERLFDVTELIRQGLTDDEVDGLPLIVGSGGATATATPAPMLVPKGTKKKRDLPSVHGAAVVAGKGRAFWKGFSEEKPVSKVWLDGRVKADMAESNAQIGTPEAWQAGLTGAGVTVAVLDSGVDETHPDLAGRISTARNFVDGEDSGDVADRDGHGTHVTSTLGGSGAASDGQEKGVAPGVTLAVGKVLDDTGYATESQIIAGMEWAARDVHARIVSMSLGSEEPSDGTDPMAQAVDTLTAETGALFVAAAGNTGAPSSVVSPGAADDALTVGGVDSADQAAWFTSAGPRLNDNALKPDISAPGVDILAARSSLTYGDGPYTTLSGTSMATPHVAGVAALLAQQHPDWTGAQLKDALMSTSKELDTSAYVLGAGRVDVSGAVHATVTATGSADLGFHSFPYDADKPVTKTVTYTNSGSEPAELALSVEGAPDGVATLADSTLTVPSHGTASTTVTGDAMNAVVGTTSGRIVASVAGKPVAHTAFGLVKEGEHYNLTVHVKDRDGNPAPGATLDLQKLAEGEWGFQAVTDKTGTVNLRLDPGTYSVSSFLDVHGSHGPDSLGLGFLADPQIDLTQDREITLDGTALKEIRTRTDERTETRQLIMEYAREANGAEQSEFVQVPGTYDSIFAAPTRKVTEGTFEYRTVWRLGKPQLQIKGVDEATVQSGGTLTDGTLKLPLVDVGTGPITSDAAGKAVLATLTDGTDPSTLARSAQDAGVKALIVTDDTPGRLSEWWGDNDDNSDRPFVIASVNQRDAARLRRSAMVELTGTVDTPYVYDLTKGYDGAVPHGTLVYEPDDGQLATIETKFHGRKAASGSEFRYLLTDRFDIALGFLENTHFPAERTDHVTAGSGLYWTETAVLGPSTLEERGGPHEYRGGTHPTLDWFKPVWRPWLGTGLSWGQQRTGNQLQLNAPGWGDSGPDHTGSGDVWSDTGMTQETAVYLDGDLVDQVNPGSGAYVRDAPADEHTYRLVTDTTLDPDTWGLASRGHTEWTFRSAETPDDHGTLLPLINIGYDIDTDLAGDVPGGTTIPVGIGAEYVVGAEGTGTMEDGTLEVSYDDGATWETVSLTRTQGEESAVWTGELSVPAGASYVSLRATARDDKGGSVTQETVRAVGVERAGR